jgi:hypothetical protein
MQCRECEKVKTQLASEPAYRTEVMIMMMIVAALVLGGIVVVAPEILAALAAGATEAVPVAGVLGALMRALIAGGPALAY